MTQPWFFKIYKGESKGVLSKIMASIDDKKFSKIKIDKFLEKIKLSDSIIAVFMNRDKNNRIPEWEEIAAVSMAVQNMWLSCYVNNIGSYWSTTAMKDEYAKHLNLRVIKGLLDFFSWGVTSMLNLIN